MHDESTMPDRRDFLAITGGALAALATARANAVAPLRTDANVKQKGIVVTQGESAETGVEILKSGGNAVDAAVATALVAGVMNLSKCGIGGYGGHMMIGLPNGKATAIDFNSTAPAAARADMFPMDKSGNIQGNLNKHGWLSAGVPGTLAGLQLALDKYGTFSWKRVLQPAIESARNGFPLPRSYTYWRNPSQPDVPRDPASAKLFSRNGKPLKKGETFRNPDLADMLQQLAEDGSADAFYRGEIAQRIARAFQKNGGIVTADDMASFRAREVTPLNLEWHGHTIATAPLTAGGISILQTIASLRALHWDSLPKNETARTQAWLEALRIAWRDRLNLLGDPEHVDVPIDRLLSDQYAHRAASEIKSAIAGKRPIPITTDGRTAGGTVHVSAVDGDGMMVSVTLTHGEEFGAQVAVDGLGLILGHGMSRFDPVPGRPNSVAPGKRPLHNMCPTIVFRQRRPVLALGGTGGRRIPNAVFQVLLGVVAERRSLQDAVAIPRLHTEGGLDIHAERAWPEADTKYLKSIGYKIQNPLPSFVYAVQQGAKGSGSAMLGVADISSVNGTPIGIRDVRPDVTHAR
jgi:gamma-glutamyltranspeptidase/glutathione hydrolase